MLTGFNSTLSFAGMEVIACGWMTKQVFDYPQDPFIEYGPEDIWWLTKYEGRKWKTVPKEEVVVVGGKVMMHPAMIDKFVAAMSAVQKQRERIDERVCANAAATATVDCNLESLLGLKKHMEATLGLPKNSWFKEMLIGRYWK